MKLRKRAYWVFAVVLWIFVAGVSWLFENNLWLLLNILTTLIAMSIAILLIIAIELWLVD